ncbi:GNAT family N-acetyltransferase [Saccharibacillus sp. VR-M41]|uniref:GNAT family N-acetyltransferase n=1 Tax=Saccharibacillus alkalitolerans TaxID=2705290 RepID=A0ABX0F9S3_9BACL|nr:GNAT family N-acetyltransferase [Saccharibacillus alkalitolerans]
MRYLHTLDSLTEDRLAGGFFEDWPNPPSPSSFLRLLKGSSYVVLAENADTGQIVGFVNALSDGVLSAYIPLLEVIPEYRGHGIGQELVRLILEKLDGHYMVDLLCDAELESFYAKLNLRPAGGMMLRNYKNQSGMP